MKKIIFVLLLFIPGVFYAQEKFTLSGFVSDKNNGENIIGVNINIIKKVSLMHKKLVMILFQCL